MLQVKIKTYTAYEKHKRGLSNIQKAGLNTNRYILLLYQLVCSVGIRLMILRSMMNRKTILSSKVSGK